MAKIKIEFKKTTPTQRRKKIRELGKQLDINQSLESLIEKMHSYEAKYGMSTIEFYARYVTGKMGDSRDVILWAGAFDDYRALLREHFHHAAA
ncbi:MAG: hypothetical protein J2P41_08195 [Blastocatellia bacterium]|nr:hypothetical protein [Blastocatellia bacterium]